MENIEIRLVMDIGEVLGVHTGKDKATPGIVVTNTKLKIENLALLHSSGTELGIDLEYNAVLEGYPFEVAAEIVQILIAWLATSSNYTCEKIRVFGKPVTYSKSSFVSWCEASRDAGGEWVVTPREDL